MGANIDVGRFQHPPGSPFENNRSSTLLFKATNDYRIAVRSNQPQRRICVRADRLRDAAREVLGAERDYVIADHLGIGANALSRLMTRTTQPSERVIANAITVLGKPFADLFEIVDVAA